MDRTEEPPTMHNAIRQEKVSYTKPIMAKLTMSTLTTFEAFEVY